MTSVTTVPFSKLVATDAINARAATKDGIDELAASIAAKGIIQPLCVRPADGEGGRYEVIDGRRRYQAMQMLVRAKTWSRSREVPVLVRNEDDAEALETSLMANTVRLPMHPVDQFAVFARLEAKGHTTDDLASRFGMSARVVRQRLALGKLAAPVRAAWKAGKIDDKTAQAFCLHPDHAVQAALYERLAKERHYGGATDWRVRQELSRSRVRVDQSDELALIGEDAYLAAGGTIEDDLFEDARYLGDVPLANKMARDLLQAECDRLRAAGWAWSEIEDRDNRTQWWAWDNAKGEDFDAEETEYDPAAWTAQERARAGCIVRIISDEPGTASIQVIAGLIRPDDSGQADLEVAIVNAASGRLPTWESEAASEADESEAASEDNDTATISGALLETITRAQTEAAREALLAEPRLALRLVIAALGTSVWRSPVKIRIDPDRSFPHVPISGEFSEHLLVTDDEDTLHQALAEKVSGALDLVVRHGNSNWDAADLLVAFLPADAYLVAARRHFLAEDYFKRASKAVAFEALDEMAEAGVVPSAQVEALADAKKADIAAFAAEIAQRCGWLPPQLRHPAYELGSDPTSSGAVAGPNKSADDQAAA